ncbi:hypothetical protein GCM10028783_21500 [Modestobacter muralis]
MEVRPQLCTQLWETAACSWLAALYYPSPAIANQQRDGLFVGVSGLLVDNSGSERTTVVGEERAPGSSVVCGRTGLPDPSTPGGRSRAREGEKLAGCSGRPGSARRSPSRPPGSPWR